MTPELHEALLEVGEAAVSWIAAYLRGGGSTRDPVRDALSDVLAGWSPEQRPSGEPCEVLVQAVAPLVHLSAAEFAVFPLAYRLRVADAQASREGTARVVSAAWREVDWALFAALLRYSGSRA